MTTKLKLPEVLGLFKAYHRTHPEWGSLHVVLADGNVETSFVEYCREYAKSNNDIEGYMLASLLLRMSKTQRRKLGAIA